MNKNPQQQALELFTQWHTELVNRSVPLSDAKQLANQLLQRLYDADLVVVKKSETK